MKNKIYIIGPAGAGKSTFARQISKKYGHKHWNLDYIIYEYDSNNKEVIFTEKTEITTNIDKIMKSEKWVIEDVGNPLFLDIYELVDLFILLEPPLFIRKYRIIKRFIKRLIGFENYGFEKDLSFKEKINFVKSLLILTMEYDDENNPLGGEAIRDRLKDYEKQIQIFKSNKDINKFIYK